MYRYLSLLLSEHTNYPAWLQAGSASEKSFRRRLEEPQDKTAQQRVRIMTRSPAAVGPLAGTNSFHVRRQEKTRMGEVVMDVVSLATWYVRKMTHRLLLISHPRSTAVLPVRSQGTTVGVSELPH
jgi:hypothetical protein